MVTNNNLPATIASIGSNIKGIKGNINTTILDFSNGVPINDGTLHTLGEKYSSASEAKAYYVGVPIDECALKLGGWQNISVAWCVWIMVLDINYKRRKGYVCFRQEIS